MKARTYNPLKTLAIGVLAILVALTLSLSLEAAGKTGKKAAPTPMPAPDEITGVVEAVHAFHGDLLLVLTHWPVTIRLTSGTAFTSEEGWIVSKDTALTALPGKAVKITKHMSSEGENVADQVTVLSYEKLVKLQQDLDRRFAPIVIPNKDVRTTRGGR